jgi:hypothetical protein
MQIIVGAHVHEDEMSTLLFAQIISILLEAEDF